MINKAFEILTDDDNGHILIEKDNGTQCIQLFAFEFELDDEDERIYYDVKSDVWGTFARVDYNLYKNNLAKTIQELLEENGINCKINSRLGRIRIL